MNCFVNRRMEKYFMKSKKSSVESLTVGSSSAPNPSLNVVDRDDVIRDDLVEDVVSDDVVQERSFQEKEVSQRRVSVPPLPLE